MNETVPQTPDPATLRLILAQVEARSARLDASTTKLDTKATTLLGFILALATFLASQETGGWWQLAPFSGLAAAAALGLMALRVRKFRDAPKPGQLAKEVAGRSEDAALSLLIQAKVKAFDQNRKTHERKATYWQLSLAALMIAVVLMVVVLTLGGDDANRNQRGPGGGQSTSHTAD